PAGARRGGPVDRGRRDPPADRRREGRAAETLPREAESRRLREIPDLMSRPGPAVPERTRPARRAVIRALSLARMLVAAAAGLSLVAPRGAASSGAPIAASDVRAADSLAGAGAAAGSQRDRPLTRWAQRARLA